MTTPFQEILREAVERTPGALGGAFAASDGELVDCISAEERIELDFLTAHYGILLAHVQAALHTFHFGEAELVVVSHEDLDVLVHAVDEGYYALLVMSRPAPLAAAIGSLAAATEELRREMQS